MNILNPYSKHNHKWIVFTKIYNLGQLEGWHNRCRKESTTVVKALMCDAVKLRLASAPIESYKSPYQSSCFSS